MSSPSLVQCLEDEQAMAEEDQMFKSDDGELGNVDLMVNIILVGNMSKLFRSCQILIKKKTLVSLYMYMEKAGNLTPDWFQLASKLYHFLIVSC